MAVGKEAEEAEEAKLLALSPYRCFTYRRFIVRLFTYRLTAPP